MINLSRVIRAPRFKQSFNVYRSTGHFGRGGWIEDVQNPPSFTMSGVIYPSSEQEIQQVPEADRIQGMMTFVTNDPLYVTRKGDTESGTSDKAEWRGELYRILSSFPYGDYGFYMAIGARISGE